MSELPAIASRAETRGVRLIADVSEEELPPPPPQAGPLGALVDRSRDVWHARGLLYEFALRDVRVRYRQAVLGLVWALLIPTLTVLAGVVLRLVTTHGGVSGPAIGDRAAIASVIVKAVAWSFFSGSLGFATVSLASNAGLVARVYFPREILPLAAVLAQGVDLAAGAATAVLLLAVLRISVAPTVLWAVLLFALLIALTTAVAAVCACANLFFRDVRYVVQVVTSFGVLFTPVFFDAAQMGHRAARLVMLNPLSPILEGFRLSVVGRHNLLRPLILADGAVAWQPWYLAYSIAWVVAGAVASALLYARLELVFAEYV